MNPRELDPLWYKDAIIYEVHVRAFYDANGDGIGDFQGLMEKLGYLQDLGVTALWLLPFYPSPLRDGGYDIGDYYGIHERYGTLQDFKRFIKAAHEHGMAVITELVVNHTSDAHPWFQLARRSPRGSPERDYYVWSDTDQKYKDTRIIFIDTEPSNWTYDPVAGQYFWHRFFSHQPDLNYDNPKVLREVLRVLRFWLKMGVDGLRLDAIPYLIEREGTNCENLPETHMVLKKLRAEIDKSFDHRMLLAEANQWPADVCKYFGDADECHMGFHFPLMPRIYMALRQEDTWPILDIMRQTPDIPESCQWALFLRNHDELTLEMVTDEERDFMYGAYASDPQMRCNVGIRRRLAPLLNNSRRRIELLNSLLMSFPGTPVIYYGDEIGMGDNIFLGDRDGVRTPMQWSGDRNAGFSRADSARLYSPVIVDPVYGYMAINVEAQERDPSSLLQFMRRIIALRKRHKTFGRGSLRFVETGNRKVLAYLREYEGETILCVANMSRFVQPAEVEVAELEGAVPTEMFGNTEFPPLGRQPFFLTLGPHTFYWFLLKRAVVPVPHPETAVVVGSPAALFEDSYRPLLQVSAARYLKRRDGVERPWQLVDHAVQPEAEVPLVLLYLAADRHESWLPLTLVAPDQAPSDAVLFNVTVKKKPLVAVDALRSEAGMRALITSLHRQWHQGTRQAVVRSLPFETAPPDIFGAPRGDTNVVRWGNLTLTCLWNLPAVSRMDLRLHRVLRDSDRFSNIARVVGRMEYVAEGDPHLMAVLWSQAKDGTTASQYIREALAHGLEGDLATARVAPLRDMISSGPTPDIIEVVGSFLHPMRLLGKCCGELHAALLEETVGPDRVPRPATRSEMNRRIQGLVDMVAAAPPEEPLVQHVKTRLHDWSVRPPQKWIFSAVHGALRPDNVYWTHYDWFIGPVGDAPRLDLVLSDVTDLLVGLQLVAAQVCAVMSSEHPTHAEALQRWTLTWVQGVNAAIVFEYLPRVAPSLETTPAQAFDWLETLWESRLAAELIQAPPLVRAFLLKSWDAMLNGA